MAGTSRLLVPPVYGPEPDQVRKWQLALFELAKCFNAFVTTHQFATGGALNIGRIERAGARANTEPLGHLFAQN